MSEPNPQFTAPTPAPAAPAQEPRTEQTQQGASADDKPATPPWGDDFDPARAWHTIQSLREREKELSKVVPMTEEKQKQLDEYNRLVEASQTDAERREKAEKAALERATTAESEAIRYKIALRHGISEDDFDLLGSGTEEQIEARATKVAAKNEAAKQAALEAAVQPPASPAPRRPAEQLRPGASPSPDPVQDDSYYPTDWLSPSQRAALERTRS